jgi:D-alanyl-D-alanine endopeptidase (penicillin-binding protein 7)
MSAFVPALGLDPDALPVARLADRLRRRGAGPALRNSARVRYAVGCGALLACLCWPAAGLYQRLARGQRQRCSPSPAAGRPAGARQLARPGPAAARIVGVWALCAAVLALRMALGMLWIERSASRMGATHAAGRRACRAWRTMRA